MLNRDYKCEVEPDTTDFVELEQSLEKPQSEVPVTAPITVDDVEQVRYYGEITVDDVDAALLAVGFTQAQIDAINEAKKGAK